MLNFWGYSTVPVCMIKRFAHLKTVERIIGSRMGTGGSSGMNYLTRALGASFFPELLKVRTSL